MLNLLIHGGIPVIVILVVQDTQQDVETFGTKVLNPAVEMNGELI